MQPERLPGVPTTRRVKHARIRTRIVQVQTEVIRSWIHLTAEQRAEAERVIATADICELSAFVNAHLRR